MKNLEKDCCIVKTMKEEIKDGNSIKMVENNENRKNKLEEVYKDLFGIEINEENANLSFKKLGIDSMQVVTILVEIQDRIGCDLYDSDVDLMKLRTFNDLMAAMDQCS